MKTKFGYYARRRVWYEFLWNGVLFSVNFYFNRWQVANYHNVPSTGPTIYASNHQNAFLDALAIIASNKRHPIFLTRADIFKSNKAAFWLRSINMIPIYRIRDGKESLAKNDAVIKECTNILIDGRQPLAIFPEGNHKMHRSLRPLKKGLGRIAFAAMEATNYELDLKIVPVGINYSRHSKMRGDLLVNFGPPISVKDYVDVYNSNPTQALLNLRDDVAKSIKPLILDISDDANYEAIEKIWAEEKVQKANMLEELENDQLKVKQYLDLAASGSLDTSPEQPKKVSKNWLKLILGAPFFLYGFLNNLIAYLALNQLIGKVVSDVHFKGSMKVAVIMVLVPIIYLLQTVGVYALSGSWLISFFYSITLPFLGVFALDYFEEFIEANPKVELVGGYFK
jgi:1-acyl-sn-glycerol-3-phosphate acyltransferase